MRTAAAVGNLHKPSWKHHRRGTHRAVSPEETLSRIRGLLPAFGITRVANVTGLDRIGLPVVSVCRPNARSISVDQGKGLDLVAAKVSGVMESIEGYLAEQIALPLLLGSYEELRYTRKLIDAETLPRSKVRSFDPDESMLWIEGHDLLRREDIWVPHQMVHVDYSLALPGEECFRSTSTGLASGNNLPEATVHAICETIERDAMTLWLLQSEQERAASRVDLTTILDPDCQGALAKIVEAELYAAVWEITSDIAVPAFACQIIDPTAEAYLPFSIATGTGCHTTREIALLRAITEAAQARLTLIVGARDDIGDRWFNLGEPEKVRSYCEEVRGAATPRSFKAAPGMESELFSEDIEWLLSQLEARGLNRIVAIDLSRPEFGVAAVKVIVPGLEDGEDLPSYIPGRRAIARARAKP